MSHFLVMSKAGLETPSPHMGRRQAQHGLPMLSTPPWQPHGCKSHSIPPPHANPSCSAPLQCSRSPSYNKRPPMGCSCPCCRAECELEKKLLELLRLLLPQLPAHDLFNPNLSSHKYTSSWQETCFSYTCPCFSESCFQQLVLSAPAPIIFSWLL